MKRGLFGLVSVVLLLSLPAVLAAETFLDLIFGTSDESILFLKIAYAMLIFIIFVKVSKESVFSKEQEKLANMFSLLLAFFALRFTPDSVVEAFGWVIMLIAPFIIFYKLGAIFIKEEKDKFSWPRFFLALFGTLLLWFALGSTDTLGISIGSTPYVGGFFDEFFSDVHYYLFSSLSPFFVMFIVALVLGALFMLLSRIRGGTGSGTGGFGDSFLRAFLWVLAIGAILLLLGALLGGGLNFGLGSLAELLTILGYLGLLLLAIFLIYLFIRFGGWRMFPWIWAGVGRNWSWLRWVLLVLVGIAVVIALLVYFPWLLYVLIPIAIILLLYLLFRNRTPAAPGAATNGTLVLTLEAGAQNVGNIAVAGAPIAVAPGSVTPFVLRAYRRRIFRNVPLAGANFTVIRVNNGTITPATGTSDPNGTLRPVPNYTAPNVAGNAQLHIELTHPEINPATVIPDRAINIGVVAALQVRNPAPAPGAAIDVGNFIDIVVEVDDGLSGVNGANVEIIFPGTPGLGPLRGATLGGSAGTAAVAGTPARRNWRGRIIPGTAGTPAVLGTPAMLTIRTPPFAAAGTYNYQILVTAPGFANPAPVPGAITVNNPRRDSLEIFNQRALVGGRVVSVPTLAAPLPIRVGQDVTIELSVRVPAAGATPARMIDTASVVILPSTRISPVVRAGAGRYTATFRPTAAEIGPQRLVLEATLAGYNNAPVQYLDLEVEDLETLNVAVIPPVNLRAGMTGVAEIRITNAAGAAVNAQVEIFAGATIPAGSSALVRGRSGVALPTPAMPAHPGVYYFPYTAPATLVNPVMIPFTVRVQETGYHGPVERALPISVDPAAQVDILFTDQASTPIPTGPGTRYQTLLNTNTGLNIQVLERGTGHPAIGKIEIITSKTGAGFTLIHASGNLNATGQHKATFRGTTANTSPGYSFILRFHPAPGFIAPAPMPFIIAVEAPQMDVQVDPVATIQIASSTPTLINLQVRDRITTNLVPDVSFSLVRAERAGTAPITSLPPTILTLPHWNATTYTSGQLHANAPLIPGTWRFHLLARAPAATGYVDVPFHFDVDITAQPHMRVTVNWVPEPANRYMLMNFVVIDAVTGANIDGADIAMSEMHTNPVFVDRNVLTRAPRVVGTTDNTGQLRREIHIDLGGRTVVGVANRETHRLIITVSNRAYVQRTGTIQINFNHPRAPMGGPQSQVLR